MQVRVTFYGGLQRVVGARELQLKFPNNEINLNQLATKLLEQKPLLKAHIKTAVFSVGTKIAGSEQVVRDGDEVGLLPPVSGG